MKRLLVLLIICLIPLTTLAAERNAFQYYYQGEYNQAHPMLLALAKNNNPQALYLLAKMNLFGYGMKKNAENGFNYMQRAANLKSLKAQMYLGAYYLHQKKNIKETLVWLRKAADQGNANAQMFTALCYWHGLGTSKNLDIAKRYIILAAKNGIPMAQFLLATIFLQSRHAIDKKMGRIWLAKAAQNHYADAKQILANIQSTGNFNTTNLNTLATVSLKKDDKPWAIMIALLKKAEINIENPKRMLAENDEQTVMPTLQSLPKNTIIGSNFSLVSPNDLHMHDILVQVNRINYQKQASKLYINTYEHQIPKQADNYQEMFQKLSRLAMHGHTPAIFELALLYENGYGVAQDEQQAFALFLKAAKLHYLKSEYMVGVYCLKSRVVNKDIHIAMQWLRKAALHGNANAQLLLGNIYEHGLRDYNTTKSVKKDLARAKAMYSLAAQNGLPTAQYQLAQMYASDLFNPTNNNQIQAKDLQIAYRLYASAAKAGIKKAKLFLAFFYAARNEPKDKHKQAYEIATKFAGMRNHDAKLLLAILCDRGIGVYKSHRAALRIYRSLAKDNNVLANFMLGTYYYLNNQHDKRAEIYLAKAAEHNIAYAQYNLAIIAKNNHQLDNSFVFLLNKIADRGFNKALLLLGDYYLIDDNDSSAMQKAVHFYQKLVKKQDQDAELRLGYMYQNGIYFHKNMQHALYWYQQSAAHSNKIAQYQLGEIHFLGQGVKRNINLALKYYKQSARQQFPPAMAAIGYIKAVDQFDYQGAKKWYKKAAKLKNKQAQKNLQIIKS